MADHKWEVLAHRIARRGVKRKYTLDELMEQFKEFVKYYVEHPTLIQARTKQKKKGKKEGGEIELQGDRIERVAPMTEHAFCLWLGVSKSWFAQRIADFRNMENPDEEDMEYLDFMLRVQTFLQSQMLEGAVIGEYNGTVVASLLGLRNNVDVTSEGKAVGTPVISIVEDTHTRDDYNARKNG